MNQAPEISAVIISFSGMRFLPDCLRTLVEDLSGLSHEIIMVDNGSIDGSIEFVKSNFGSVQIIENGTNLGFARGVNIGMQAARGKYLYLLNQDLRFRKGATAALMTRLKRDNLLGMIGPKYVGFDGKLQSSARSFPTYKHVVYDALRLSWLFPQSKEFGSWRMGWFDHETELYVDQPMGSVMLLPRLVVEKVGDLDEAFPIFFNDVDFCRRIKAAGYRLLYCPEAVVEHFIGGSTRTMPARMKLESHRSMYRYLRKYAKWYEFPLLWLCGLLLLVGAVPAALAASFRTKST